jgi:tetratricopeptide (TPR) repeat protein
VILSTLGAGGMGVVYAAYDPELDRKIALKLLHPEPGAGSGPSSGKRRLVREAQAMARLSHPNTIAVHDVGTHGDDVFVAMEYVDGWTLSAWVRRTKPPWTEALAVLRQAGAGLAAAHAAGLVHRDFKPENVMVAKDGRVRVLDFGLAREVATGLQEGASEKVAESSGELAVDLTRTGALLGTPAYMAPEQLEGKPADARSDQFSFCVALYEALHGTRPFAGDNIATLTFQVVSANVREPPADSKVPTWIHRIILRGLSAKPDDRFASMDALLAQLRRDPGATRRRTMTIGATIVVVSAAVLWAVWQKPESQEMCAGGEERVAEVWSPARAAAVENAFLAIDVPYAGETAKRVQARLDGYAAEWVSMYRSACEATHVRGEQSGELLDLRMACLGGRLEDLGALADVLEQADEQVLQKAPQATASLRPLARCADADALRAQVPPPEDATTAGKVDTVRKQLAQARALHGAGKYKDGLKVADAAVDEAARLGYDPLQAEARLTQGRLKESLGDYPGSETSLEASFFFASATRHDDVASESAALLTAVVGYRLARHDEGLQWGRHADAAVERVGRDGVEEALLLHSRSAVLRAKGDREAAVADGERALEIRERVLGPDHHLVARSLNNLGGALYMSGEYDRAREQFARSIEVLENAVGAGHPTIAPALSNLGSVAFGQGDYVQAETHYRRALEIMSASLDEGHPDLSAYFNNMGNVLEKRGDAEGAERHHLKALAIREANLDADHPHVAMSLDNIGGALRAQQRYEEAAGYHRRALEIREKRLGTDHRDVAMSRNNLGSALQYMKRWKEAEEQFRLALEIRKKALGPDHPDVALCIGNLGNLAAKQGQFGRARKKFDEALRIREKALPADHPLIATALSGRGQASLELGKVAEAIADLERAIAIYEKADVNVARLASAQLGLARALAKRGDKDGRALELARAAVKGYEASGRYYEKELVDAKRWLARHKG